MIMTPRLVVLSGYPSSGKTTIARYMQRELGFERVASDDLRLMLFGVAHPELMKDPEYNLKEWEILWPLIDRGKAYLLTIGRDVVVDSTAAFNDLRRTLLNTRYGNVEIPAEKYLAIIHVDKEVLRQRDHPDAIETWNSFWNEPESNPIGYEVLSYVNNTPEDREAIQRDLRRRFEKRGELFVPKNA